MNKSIKNKIHKKYSEKQQNKNSEQYTCHYDVTCDKAMVDTSLLC